VGVYTGHQINDARAETTMIETMEVWALIHCQIP
jgi:hypothetical protein